MTANQNRVYFNQQFRTFNSKIMTLQFSNDYKNFQKKEGQLLRKLREEKKYKSAELFAFHFGYSRNAYWRWENGEPIHPGKFFELLKLHKLTHAQFFERLDKEFPHVK